MEIMRHESMETRMKFGGGRNANATAGQIWATYKADNRHSNNEQKTAGNSLPAVRRDVIAKVAVRGLEVVLSFQGKTYTLAETGDSLGNSGQPQAQSEQD